MTALPDPDVSRWWQEVEAGLAVVTAGPWTTTITGTGHQIYSPAGDAELGNWLIAGSVYWPENAVHLSRMSPGHLAAALTERAALIARAEMAEAELTRAAEAAVVHAGAAMRVLLTRAEAAEKRVAELEKAAIDTPCTHKGYRFDKDGRRCPHCGTMMTDFGD